MSYQALAQMRPAVSSGFNVVNRVNRREGVIAHYRQQRERASANIPTRGIISSKSFEGTHEGNFRLGVDICGL
jgi:hypothetical protein